MRFPKGWERSSPGSYLSAEEFIVLEGSLEMNGRGFQANDWVYVPDRVTRRNTASPDGALTLASFLGPSRWTAVKDAETQEQEEILTRKLEPSGESTITPLGGRGWLLFPGQLSSSWLIESLDGGISAVNAEVFEIESKVWAWVPKGSTVPVFNSRCFCRTFDQ